MKMSLCREVNQECDTATPSLRLLASSSAARPTKGFHTRRTLVDHRPQRFPLHRSLKSNARVGPVRCQPAAISVGPVPGVFHGCTRDTQGRIGGESGTTHWRTASPRAETSTPSLSPSFPPLGSHRNAARARHTEATPAIPSPGPVGPRRQPPGKPKPPLQAEGRSAALYETTRRVRVQDHSSRNAPGWQLKGKEISGRAVPVVRGVQELKIRGNAGTRSERPLDLCPPAGRSESAHLALGFADGPGV